MSKKNKVSISSVLLYVILFFLCVLFAFFAICKKHTGSKAYDSVEEFEDKNFFLPQKNNLVAEKVWRIMEVIKEDGTKDWIPILVDDSSWEVV